MCCCNKTSRHLLFIVLEDEKASQSPGVSGSLTDSTFPVSSQGRKYTFLCTKPMMVPHDPTNPTPQHWD